MTTQKPYLNTNEFLEMSEMLTSSKLYSGDPTQEYDIYEDTTLANQDWLWWLDNYLTNRSTAIYSRTDLQTSGSSSVHWDNITSKPVIPDGSWKGPIASVAALPAVGNTDGDVYLVIAEDYFVKWESAGSNWVIISETYFATLASPTFTGIPAAPTAVLGTSTTQLATTAFVATAVAGVSPWVRDGGSGLISPIIATDTVGIGAGIEDAYVTTAIPFGDASNTALTVGRLASTSIVGAMNELVGSNNIVDLRNYAALADALTAIGATDATIFIPEAYDYGVNTVIPSNITLWFTEGGSLNATGAYSLTIEGKIVAPHQTTIFTHTSGIASLDIIFSVIDHPEDVKISDSGNDEIWVDWFGAVGDGVTDDTAAIEIALDSAYNGGILIKASGVYYLTGTVQIQDQDVDFGNATFIYDDGIFEYDGTSWAISGRTIANQSWANTTVYSLGDFVYEASDKLYYECTVGGTSNGTYVGDDVGCTWVAATPTPFGSTAILIENKDTINGSYMVTNRTIKLPKLWKYANTLAPGVWTSQGTGVNLVNLYHCKVYFNLIRNFEYGVVVEGDVTGNSYNEYYMGHIENCKIPLHLTATNDGWSNENNYYGGRFTIWSVERTYELEGSTATAGGAFTITDTGAGWGVNAYAGMVIEITAGTGSDQKRVIASNTADIITINSAWDWDTTPDATSVFRVWDVISGTKAIYLEHTSANYPNNNVFYKPCFESNEFEYVIDCGGRQNQFIQPRFEGYMMNVNLVADARENYFNSGYGLTDYGFQFVPLDTANKSQTTVISPNGSSMFNEPIMLGHRTTGTNMLSVYSNTTEILTADRSTDYVFAISDTYVKTKGTTHTYDSIKIDIEEGKLYFGDGSAEPTRYIDYAGGNMPVRVHAFLTM